MEQRNLKQIIFMLFDENLLDEVVRIYEKNDYIVEDDDDIRIAYQIAKVYTTSETEQVLEHLNNIKNYKVSEIFPDLHMLRASLAMDCLDNNILPYDKVLTLFSKDDLDRIQNENPTVYNTPCYQKITVNGNDHDDNLNNISKCLAFMKDNVIFRRTVEKVDDKGYKYYLKVQHALQTVDYEYGIQAVRDLEEHYYIDGLHAKVNKNNYQELLSVYQCIIDFIGAFQALGYKFSETPEYIKLKEIFKNLLPELRVDSLLIGEVKGEIVLKTLAETKKRLIKDIGFEEDEVRDFMEPIFERIRDTNLEIIRDIEPIKK